jgi:hypothetical protein
MLRRLGRPLAAALVTVLLVGCAPSEPVASTPLTGTVETLGSGPRSDDPTIPANALLTADDVGMGYIVTDSPQGDDHGSLTMLLAYCGVDDYSQAPGHVLATERTSVGRDEEDYLLATVTRYEVGWAERHLDDLRTALAECDAIPVMGNPDDIAAMTMVELDTAGDGSLLLREVRPTGTQYHAVIRQGDLEARLRIHTGGDESHARAIMNAAAERLCASVEAC